MERRFATYAKIDISSGDFQRLAPGRWLNDRIIELYSQWVMNQQAAAEIRDQVYLASPFLYRKIARAIPNEKLLLRQAQRNRVAEKKCLIIPICEQAHWRLWIVAHPDLTAEASAIYVIDSLENYPTEEIAAHIRRYIQLLNRGKHGQDLHCDSQSLPLRKVQVPVQANQSDCGVYLLRNLEAYLQQDETRWDPHALPLAWCTAAEAQ
ncbi:hypothetical protein GQX74_009953 [Glossina fuscipes]|nr:hypothetical protein GQX74_009953 [Glossina fuscipes]